MAVLPFEDNSGINDVSSSKNGADSSKRDLKTDKTSDATTIRK